MALVIFNLNEGAALRPGDVIFHHRDRPAKPPEQNPTEEVFPTHACIYVGPGEDVQGPVSDIRVRVRGVPGYRRAVTPEGGEGDILGDCTSGMLGAWYANLAGQMLNVDPIQLKHVVLLSEAVSREHSQLGQQCEWDARPQLNLTRMILGGHPLFERGSCSQFVEYLYERSGLDVVAEATRDPKDPDRICPATQIAAFWAGEYPLEVVPWDVRLTRYPSCLEVCPRRTDR